MRTLLGLAFAAAALLATPPATAGAVSPGERLQPSLGSPRPRRVAVPLVTSAVDFHVTAGVSTATTAIGSGAEFYASVSSTYPPIGASAELIDFVPKGLEIESATVDAGSCVIAGQVVRCRLSLLVPGTPARFVLKVMPSATGAYVNDILVMGVWPDISPTDDSAETMLTVVSEPPASPESPTAPESPARRCTVPPLRNTPTTVATNVLKLLRCKVGTIKRTHAHHVRKGDVIGTGPGPGVYPATRRVNVVVSLGVAKRHVNRHRRRSAAREPRAGNAGRGGLR